MALFTASRHIVTIGTLSSTHQLCLTKEMLSCQTCWDCLQVSLFMQLHHSALNQPCILLLEMIAFAGANASLLKLAGPQKDGSGTLQSYASILLMTPVRDDNLMSALKIGDPQYGTRTEGVLGTLGFRTFLQACHMCHSHTVLHSCR